MSDSSYVIQKASIWALFVFLTFAIGLPGARANDCNASHFHETVQVAHVYDGDTVELSDGRKLRFIGINTPEHGRDGQQDEPFYLAARQHLQKIIINNNHRLKIIFGKETQDRYQRHLAHIFTIEGENITALLLSKGLGFSIAIPPNIRFLKCYQNAEGEARRFKRGLWNHAFSHPIEATALSTSTRGFQQVTGTVKRIGESRSSYWLNLATNQATKFALRIQKKDVNNFTSYHPSSLMNKRVVARGWIYQQNNELRMSVRHPASLHLQNTD